MSDKSIVILLLVIILILSQHRCPVPHVPAGGPYFIH